MSRRREAWDLLGWEPLFGASEGRPSRPGGLMVHLLNMPIPWNVHKSHVSAGIDALLNSNTLSICVGALIIVFGLLKYG